jgi:hypothetical protein
LLIVFWEILRLAETAIDAYRARAGQGANFITATFTVLAPHLWMPARCFRGATKGFEAAMS